MRKIVIIEDEAVAAAHLGRLLTEVVPDAKVAAVLQSIEESVEYFSQSDTPDLVFMDIHLADGSAFRIFDRVEVPCPVVFTTAYDQYALEAFKVNSIDYLLKPIDADALRRAMDKLERLQGAPRPDMASLAEALARPERTYKRTFLIPKADKLLPVRVDDVACICLDSGTTRILPFDDIPPISMDMPLDSIMERLDPSRFYRANRQYIVAYRAIKEISVWPIGKLVLTLTVTTPDRIVVSKAKVPEFKAWYTR